jgi:hypothetical protein
MKHSDSLLIRRQQYDVPMQVIRLQTLAIYFGTECAAISGMNGKQVMLAQ